MGYKKVSLIHTPIPLQFKLLDSRIFAEFKPSKEDIPNKDILYKKSVKGEQESRGIINLMILDTYSNNVPNIPEQLKKYRTVIVIRSNDSTVDGQRAYSENLLQIVQTALNENAGVTKYNLFLYTNPYTNIKLYNDVFNTVNDARTLNIYFFDNVVHKFENKKITIVC